MSNHNEIKELLAAYALGDLSGDQAKIVTEHITQCQSCKQELESMRLVLDCAGQMSKVSVDDDMYVSAKEGLLSSLTPEKTAKTIQWRTIMQNKVTKFATAAVIILGAFLGMYMLGISPDGSSVAWASLAQRVGQVQTVEYRINSLTKYMPGGGTQKSLIEVKASSEHGIRMDIFNNGKLAQQAYMLYADKTQVTIMTPIKKFMRVTLTDEMMDTMAKQSYDPREMVAGFMKNDYVELGQKEINGFIAEGIEVQNSVIGGMPVENAKGQLWVDVNTSLPVLIEIEMEREVNDNSMSIAIVIDDFQWDVEIDNNEFAYVIPADFKSAGEAKMPESNAKSVVECLAMIAKAIDGKYPRSVSLEKCGKEVSEAINEKKKQANDLLVKVYKEVKDAGIDPKTSPEVLKAEAIKKSLDFGMNEQMKIYGLCMFYVKLTNEKKDPAYYGDRITADDTGMILMRWLNDKDGYTVIFADLSTGDFTVEQIVEMELELPDRPAEVQEVPAIAPPTTPVEVPAVAPADDAPAE